MKKKLAIISSYSESCGNAAFTKILHDSIESIYSDVEVDVVELDLGLLQSIEGDVRKKADNHVKEICEIVSRYDAVNIQMEAGLYGTMPSDILSRYRKILSSNPRTSVTLHSPRLVGSAQSSSRSGIKKILKLDIIGGIRELIGNKVANIHVNINKKIVKYAVEKQAALIVHTSRAKRQIRDFYSYERVQVHPLQMVPANYEPSTRTLNNIKTQLELPDDVVLIGMFGYISAYKGHTDAINALKELPQNYKLLIFGRQHPQTLKSDGSVDHYLTSLLKLIEGKRKLKDRVIFLGELDDTSFLDVVSSIDVAWLPYYENGQDGSGIASICVELCKRTMCSSSFAFDQLFKLKKYTNVVRFDIGNIQEMATKTKMLMMTPIPDFPYCTEDNFNIKTQAKLYVRDLGL